MTPEEEIAYWEARSAEDGIPFNGPKRTACATCPWRLKYQDGTEANPCFPNNRTLVRHVWDGSRKSDNGGGAAGGRFVMCHGKNSVYTAPGEETYDSYTVCTGAVVVQQREAIRWHLGEPTTMGEAAAVRTARVMPVPPVLFATRQLSRADLLSRAHPSIADPLVGYHGIPGEGVEGAPPPRPGEFDADEAALSVFQIPTGMEFTEEEREVFATDPGCRVDGDGVALILASTADLATAWLGEWAALVLDGRSSQSTDPKGAQ